MANEGDIQCIDPKLYSGFDAKALQKRYSESDGGASLFLRSSDLQELSFATINLLSQARIIYTDDLASLQKLFKGIVAAFKDQKYFELTQAL